MKASTTMLPWHEIDSVLVDMDGTLLDLAFDNFFWQELVPAQFAARNGLDETRARRDIAARYEREEGRLAWYCIDHWSRELDLDLRALKWSHRHLIGYLPGAPEFLARVRRLGKPLTLVTNAHHVTLEVKVAQTRLDAHVDRMICSHDLAAPKEHERFWPELQRREGFDPARTVLIEDSLAVLAAARRFGLGMTIAVRRPDSRLPPREISEFPAVDGVGELA
jgi:GMP/IMP 5'-nucleotidase